MIGAITTLADVLANVETLPWSCDLFLSRATPLAPSTPALILEDQELLEDEDENAHPLAVANGVKYVLTISSVQDICENAKEQKSSITQDDLFKAFVFYFEHDAFIEL